VEAAVATGYAADVSFGGGLPAGAVTERAGVGARGVG